mmetsp:Transcript_13542/g.38101  ORF Transcript_13542/g.38101 Transcript_13542/m.38101 type:complete len:732 (-) Transcript_13542:694-2889(-)
MFSNTFTSNSELTSTMSPSSEAMRIDGGIARPLSLLPSFLMSRLSAELPQEESPFNEQLHQQQQQHQQQQHQQQHQHQHRPSTARLSLCSKQLPRCLLEDDGTLGAPRLRTVTDDAADDGRTSSRALLPWPRRAWKISNDDRTALPRVPPYYPPFQPGCAALVTDAPPSVVVVRISECLRKRSIAVEYDDESSVTARCMTVDRCHFEIQLFRSSSSCHNSISDPDAMAIHSAPPGSDAVIVEVRNLTSQSSRMSFHAACHKILLAAKGLDAGDDERPARCRNGAEFRPCKRRNRPAPIGRQQQQKRPKPSLLRYNNKNNNNASSNNNASNNKISPTSWSPQSSSSGSTTYYDSMASTQELHNKYGSPSSPSRQLAFHLEEAELESALELLQKDRTDCQQLGMERLVNLTNWESSRKESCRYVSQQLLSAGPGRASASAHASASARATSRILMKYLVHSGAEQASRNRSNLIGVKGTDHQTDWMVRSFLESSAQSAVSPQPKSLRSQNSHHEKSQSLFFKKKASQRQQQQQHQQQQQQQQQHAAIIEDAEDALSSDDLRHEARMRALALRVVCNALDNLSKTGELQRVLFPSADNEPSRWARPAVLLSLVQDLQGAGRPPSVSEHGYKLASVHEAALAARCLRLLAGLGGDGDDIGDGIGIGDDHEKEEEGNKDYNYNYNDDHREAVRELLRSEPVLERLSYARTCGRAAHAVLQYETERTYDRLTADVCSC